MQQRLRQFVTLVGEDPAVANVVGFTGGMAGTANSGRMFVALKPLAERQVSAEEVIARLRGKAARVPGARLLMQANQDLRMGGRQSGAQYQFTLQGDDIKELNEWAPRVLNKMRALPPLADVNSDQQNRGLEASLVIDRSTASRLGISPAMIDNALYDAFGQRQVSTMYKQLNQYYVVMTVEPQFWQSPEGLKHIYVRSANRIWCRSVPSRTMSLRPRRSRSITRDCFRPSPSRSIWRPVWRLATRSRRSSERRARWACRPPSVGAFRAWRRRFRTLWPINPS